MGDKFAVFIQTVFVATIRQILVMLDATSRHFVR
jgi:hypothetical protein